MLIKAPKPNNNNLLPIPYLVDIIKSRSLNGNLKFLLNIWFVTWPSDNRIQVSVFMSPLNIHNNLYPISGIVTYTKYHPGKFIAAWKPKASTDNERSSIVIKNNKISVLCRQIAGAVARRIVTYSKVEEKVNSGDEIGFIKFGSRVDIFLPIGTQIEVKIGEKVSGGQSIIAKY